jgi:hypothetical protein
VQAEASDTGVDDDALLSGLSPDPFVLREDDPPTAAGLAKPDFVVRVLREDVVVGDHGNVQPCRPQGVRHLPPAQAAVDEDLRPLAPRGTALRL